MLSVGEAMFWKNIYLRSLMENIKEIKTKSAIITTMNGMDSMVKLEHSELIWGNTPFVKVKSKKKQIEESAPLLAHLEAFYAIESQNPNISPLVMKIYKRTMKSLQWFDDDYIYATERTDVYEERAIRLMNIINDPEAKLPKDYIYVVPELDMKQQLEALYYYVGMAINSDKKDYVMRYISSLIIKEWVQVNQQQIANMWWVANSMWSQMLSNKLTNSNTQ